jgi:hypothetical protein
MATTVKFVYLWHRTLLIVQLSSLSLLIPLNRFSNFTELSAYNFLLAVVAKNRSLLIIHHCYE